MRRILPALGLLALSATAPSDGFAPGAWGHRTDMVSADVPGIPEWLIKMTKGHQTRKSCFTAAQAATRPEALLTQDDAASCKVRKFSMTGGAFIYDTFCINKSFPEGLLIASKGTYKADSYQISTVSTGTKEGQPVKIVTTGSGRRTAPACK